MWPPPPTQPSTGSFYIKIRRPDTGEIIRSLHVVEWALTSGALVVGFSDGRKEVLYYLQGLTVEIAPG